MKDYDTQMKILLAQAEVDRMKLEAKTIPYTTDDQHRISELIKFNNDLIRVLGAEADPVAGKTVFKGLDALKRRLDTIEDRLGNPRAVVSVRPSNNSASTSTTSTASTKAAEASTASVATRTVYPDEIATAFMKALGGLRVKFEHDDLLKAVDAITKGGAK